MADNHFFTQVALSKGTLTRYTWLPPSMAQLNQPIKVREEDGTFDHWKVSKVFEECIIPGKYVTPEYIEIS